MRPEPAHFRFWPEGVERNPAPPRTTLPAVLARTAAERPHHAAIHYAGGTLRYAELLARVDALAGYLQQRLGVQPGARVLIISQNCPQWVVACYAVLRAGAVVVPVSAMSKRAEIAFHVRDSGARLALVAQELLPQLPLGSGDDELPAAVVHAYSDALGPDLSGEDLPDVVLEARQALPPITDSGVAAALHGFEDAIACALQPGAMPADPDALAVLPYTSGTTGQPKGCQHSHATLLASISTSAVWKRMHAGSVILTVAPLFHMLGLQNGMNLPIWCGATTAMMPRWHAAVAAAQMERYQVTAWTAPPAMVLDLFSHPDTAQRDLSSLELLSGGGAAMPEAVTAMLKSRYGLSYEEGYGLSETASFLHGNPPQRCKPQCLGVPAQGVDSRIVDPDTGRELPQGEVGELVTHAPQVMLGYWRNEAANRDAFIPIEGKRFFRTGDLALVDEDGYFFLKDRLKRMINVSGYKVWPAEVESWLYAHPAVHEACIIAVPDARDGRVGEAVKALVVLKPGLQGSVSPEAFIAWCRERMAVYKAPREVEFLPSLPKSNTGKIQWRELQEMHRRTLTAARAAPTGVQE